MTRGDEPRSRSRRKTIRATREGRPRTFPPLDEWPVFRSSPPSSPQKHLGVATEVVHAARRPSRKLISTGLFYYPNTERPVFHEHSYQERFEKYLVGLRRLVQAIHLGYRDWNVRLYVDRSVLSLDSDTIEMVHTILADLVREYDHFELYGAQELAANPKPNTFTFLPAAWRFLAAFEDGLDAVVFTDLDQVVHPLYMYYVERWWKERTTSVLVLAPTNYRVIQCLPTLFDRSRSPMDDAQMICPCAQFVAVRGPLNSALWTDSLQYMNSDRLRSWAKAFFSPEYRLRVRVESHPRMRALMRRYIQEPEKVDRVYASELRAVLDDLLREEVAQKGQYASTLSAILRDETLFAWTLIFTYRTRWAQHRLLKLLESKDTDQYLYHLFVNKGYGVDEWLLTVWLASLPKSTVDVVRNPTPKEVGFQVHTHVRLSQRDTLPRLISFLQMRRGFYMKELLEGSAVEYVARVLTILSALRVSSIATGEPWSKRLREWMEHMIQHTRQVFGKVLEDISAEEWRNLVFASWQTESDAWTDLRKACIYVDSKTNGVDILKPVGVQYDPKNKAFYVFSSKGAQHVWAALREGLLMDVASLHALALHLWSPSVFDAPFELLLAKA